MSQGTTRVKCSCSGTPACAFQDRHYGKGIRIANFTAKGTTDGRGEARCTCCNAIHRDVKDAPRTKKAGNRVGRMYVALPPPDGWPGGFPEKNGWRP